MSDTNPLNLRPKKRHPVLNRSGRPAKEKEIKFGPQPQSYISQLLKKHREDSVKITLTLPRTLLLSKKFVTESQDLSRLSDEDNLHEQSKGATNQQPQIEIPRGLKEKEKLYTCNYLSCTYSTRISSNLSKHKRTHASEKPYLCDTCSFQTKFVNSLKTHKRIHTDVRPYNCIYCSYRCNSSSNLKKHCKHMHSNMLPLG